MKQNAQLFAAEQGSSTQSLLHRTWLRWLITALPLIPVVLVVLANRMPVDPAHVIDLTGDWHLCEGDLCSAADAPFVETQLPVVHLPGRIVIHEKSQGKAWLRRHFELPTAHHGQTLFLSLGYVANAWVEVYINGQHIGGKGVHTSRFYVEQSSLEGWYVPAAVLNSEGDNVVALYIEEVERNSIGFMSENFYLGTPGVVKRHFQQFVAVNNLIEQGALFALLFLGGLVAILLVLSWHNPDRRLYMSTMGLMGAVFVYLNGKTGVPLGFVVDADTLNRMTFLGIDMIGLFALEFVEEQLLKRTSIVRKVNRVLWTLLTVMTLFGLPFVYDIAAPCMFAVIAWVVVIAVGALLRGHENASPVLTVTLVLVAVAGLNDLLTDLFFWTSPRLFAVATANTGLVASLVAIGQFMRLAGENQILSASLATRNVDLAEALVKAQDSARLKAEFLANTSHELRTPLNSIINIPQGLIENYQTRDIITCTSCSAQFESDDGEVVDAHTMCPNCGQLATLRVNTQLVAVMAPAEQVRYLSSVVASGRHLLAVVNDILDFSKLEAGRMVLHAENINFVDVAEEILSSMRALADKRRIVLVFESTSEDITLCADRVKLGQILINLLSNAIKFSADGGVVHLRAQAFGDGVDIEVQDHGIGIAPEHHKMVFESFRQVEGGHTRRYSGTGLGLAITHELVKLHGGEIVLRSELGHGTTFTVHLPTRQHLLVTDPQELVSPPDNELILLVDDEDSALTTTELSLQSLGLHVRRVSDPLLVLSQLRSQRPRLLILDVMMPRKSGLQILREIRDDITLSELPVLVASAYSDNEPLVRELGAEWISKPWEPADIVTKVTAMLATISDNK